MVVDLTYCSLVFVIKALWSQSHSHPKEEGGVNVYQLLIHHEDFLSSPYGCFMHTYII